MRLISCFFFFELLAFLSLVLFGFPCDFFQLYWFSLFPCVFHTPSICIQHMARHCFTNEAMKYKGLVDPKNKPFGNLLPFEVQVIIMFWTQCFMTNDRRTKMNEELTRLPCCLRTGIPMFVAFSLSSGYKRFCSAMENKPYPRFYGCPHCFRRNTLQVSVSVFIYFPSVLFHAYH